MDEKLKQELKEILSYIFKDYDEIGFHTGCDFGVYFSDTGKLEFENPVTGAKKAKEFCEKYGIDLSDVLLHRIGNNEISEG